MIESLPALSEQYARALEDYLSGGGEAALQQAYEIGRQVLASRGDLLNLATTHQSALARLVARARTPEESAQFVLRAGTFLAETLSPFVMTQRGFEEAVRKLHDLNASLEQRIAERTEELRATNQTLQILSEVGRLLAGSLDYTVTLSNVAQAVVPQLADWCAVDIVQEDNTLQRVAVAHVDPSKAQRAYELGRGYPPDPQALRGLINVVRTGQPEIYPDITEEMLVASTRDAGQLKLLQELELKSALLVPLVARGRTLGVLTLVWAESGRRYGPADLDLAEELARRAALAVDNASLYDEARTALEAVRHLNADLEQRVAERTAELEGAVQILRSEIAERRRTERALRESEGLLAEAQQVAHLGSWHWDVRRNQLRWSEELYRIYGLDPQAGELTYEGFLDRVHPDDREMIGQTVATALVDHKPFTFYHRIVRPDGVVRILHAQGQLVLDEAGEPLTMLGTGQDVTELKQIENELRGSQSRLQALSAHLQSVREEERTRVAREIHDELGQALTSLKMDLAWLQNNVSLHPATQLAKMKSMSQMIDATVQSVRRISAELRPGVLDDLGLMAAIEWQLQEFQARTGIECQLLSAPEEIDLEGDSQTAVFRILQEALTNVMRHADASRVRVRMEEHDGRLGLRVEDNGRGITEAEMEGARSFGLIGMRERVRLLDGEFEIRRMPERGTAITVSIPLRRSQAASTET